MTLSRNLFASVLFTCVATAQTAETARTCSNPSGNNTIAAGDVVSCSVTDSLGQSWTFNASANETYSIAALETAGGSAAYPLIRVFDQSGTRIYSDDFPLRTTFSFRTTGSGAYRIEMKEFGSTLNPYSYVLSLERTVPPTASAPFLPLNLPFRSAIEFPGDRDLYQLNVQAGDRVSFRYVAESGGGRQEAILVDAAGATREIGSSAFTVPASGVFALILRGETDASAIGTVTFSCQGACPGPPMQTGLFPHYAAGEGWNSSVSLLNPTGFPVRYRVSTRAQDGQTIDRAEGSISPYGVRVLEPAGNGAARLNQGSLLVEAPSGVSGSLTFRSAEIPGQRGQQAASVPLIASGSKSWLVPFDNQNGFVSGVAVSLISSSAESVTLDAFDASGQLLESRTVTLNGAGQQAFVLADRLPGTANRRGILQARVSGDASLGLVGLRFSPAGAFTSLSPAATTQTQTAGSISNPREQFQFVPQVATGGGWSTEIFAFSRDRTTSNPISFRAYQGTGTTVEVGSPRWTGAGTPWQIAYEGGGAAQLQIAAPLGTNLTALRTSGTETDTRSGWIAASRLGDFAGLAIFRQNVTAPGRIPQEASVSFFPAGVRAFWVAADQRRGPAGLAVANPSATATLTVTATFRDEGGNLAGTSRFTMPPLAHFAATIDSLIAASAGRVGSIEVAANGDISGVGLLFEGAAFTALPAIY